MGDAGFFNLDDVNDRVIQERYQTATLEVELKNVGDINISLTAGHGDIGLLELVSACVDFG